MLQDYASAKRVLGSDDLELLQRFLDAWCEENGVEPDSDKAQAIASGLFNWYEFELRDPDNLKMDPPEPLPESDKIRKLMRQLAEV
ncbi:hypothetical protein [Neorhizobium sp. NCHU2750]|uniref:hypothetical protein n=1 Tax=Neorhizobium sp. NCHU2750 TaxID=1825976 RepID=UPI000E711C72|nr:hypothetical protein NCHU2750_19690 [Neorhizobium sp. NCHU2750]